jgi:hypothetical protein
VDLEKKFANLETILVNPEKMFVEQGCQTQCSPSEWSSFKAHPGCAPGQAGDRLANPGVRASGLSPLFRLPGKLAALVADAIFDSRTPACRLAQELRIDGMRSSLSFAAGPDLASSSRLRHCKGD